MIATVETLWLRALHAADVRGLVPAHRSPLTPGEIAAEAARRGEDRLAQLVRGWYYPASYGGVRGTLTDEDAGRIVASLEADVVAEVARADVAPAKTVLSVAQVPPARHTNCQLCGFPLTSTRVP